MEARQKNKSGECGRECGKPNAEFRMPKEARSPNAESAPGGGISDWWPTRVRGRKSLAVSGPILCTAPELEAHHVFGIGASDLVRFSDFGVRILQRICPLPILCRLRHYSAMDLRAKIIPIEQLPAWRQTLRATGKKLVVTNGCFDLLHAGHVTYLAAARDEGDALLVGINGDAAVRELKGEGRPLNSEQDRALVVAALQAVDAVCIFSEPRATQFLQAAQPDIYVKGGDYTVDTLNADERRVVEAAGAAIRIIPMVPGKSTSGLIGRM
jgi:rfaE bifunctional protein nucleotidyltransferase chain/domain